MPWVINMPKFWIWQSSEYGAQGPQYASVTQRSEYARTCLDRVLNISYILNVSGFWIWQSFEFARITQGARYAAIMLNIS